MNSLRRAVTQLASSSSSPTERLTIILQSTLYSTTTTLRKQSIPQKPTNPKPQYEEARVKKSEASAVEKEWGRPSEIPWQPKVANTVNLIGYIQMPVQFEATSDGKPWAGSILTQGSSSSDSPPLWIPIIFEGDLAHVAVSHLKEKDWVYVVGQLTADPPPHGMKQTPANVQVLVHSMNFVKGHSPLEKTYASFKQEEWTDKHEVVAKDDYFVDPSWNDLIKSSGDWWDIRSTKGSETKAAYEHKVTGQLLYFDESTPEWLRNILGALTVDCKPAEKIQKTVRVIKDNNPAVDTWKDFLNNPKLWWDNREIKLNGTVKPKYPDFKSKDGKYVLWLSDAPAWVLEQLEGLEVDVNNGNKHNHKDEKSWNDLVENPQKWWDNRLDKKNRKAPDFKHKETGQALWLNGSPSWVFSKLPPLKIKDKVSTKRDTLLS